MKFTLVTGLSVHCFLLLVASWFLLSSCGDSNSIDGGGTIEDVLGTSGYVFVSSENGKGILADWTSAGGLTGLAAADSVCKTMAENVGLSGEYIAWMTDSMDDAYCRVHGLSGKKADNCGQVTLPANAGPWLRMDDFPFAETIDPVSGITALTPVLFNEHGTAISSAISELSASTYWSNSKTNGTETAADQSCGDWTGSSGAAAGGSAFGQNWYWSYGWWIPTGCANTSTHSLLCIKKGSSTALPDYTSTGLLAFVTSDFLSADFGGLANADLICQSLANAAGLSTIGTPRTFKAWLSTSTVDAVDRITSDGPWVNLNGLKIADNKADLIDGSLFSSIRQDENGTPELMRNVFTGTNESGAATVNTCLDWTSVDVGDSATHGVSSLTNAGWTSSSTRSCNSNLSLYCLEN